MPDFFRMRNDKWPTNPPLTDEISTSGDIEHAIVRSVNSGPSMMDDFASQISFSFQFARQNRFAVTIPTDVLYQNSDKIRDAINAATPSVASEAGQAISWMNDFYAEDNRQTALELTAYCEKSELPSYQFQLETVRHYGPAFKIPHMPEYQDITMTFLCGNQMWERYFFDAWMYLIMDPVTNDFNYKNEYAVTMYITQYSEQDNPPPNEVSYNYFSKLMTCFPVAINSQELGYDINNTIQKLQVTFSFKFALPYDDTDSTTGFKLRGRQDLFGNTVGVKPNNPTPSGRT